MAAITKKIGRSRKAIAGVVTPTLAWATIVAGQPGSFQRVTAVEWVGLAIALATGLGVYQAANDPAVGTLIVKDPSVVSK